MESLRLAMHGKSVGKRLSAGTEVAAATWTPKPTEDFKSWADGTLVTTFESYQAYDRSGSDPDRFVREMRQVGMITGVDDETEESEGDLIATLDMVTLSAARGCRFPGAASSKGLPSSYMAQASRG